MSKEGNTRMTLDIESTNNQVVPPPRNFSKTKYDAAKV